MAVPISLEARRRVRAILVQRQIAEEAIDRAKLEWKKLAQMEQKR